MVNINLNFLKVFLKLNLKYILIYLLVINVIGFLAMGLDKYKAQKGYWRTPEATLMTLCLLGGGIGTIAGIYVFKSGQSDDLLSFITSVVLSLVNIE